MGALHRLCRIVALMAALSALGGSFARAEDEKVTLGTVGQASANLWPVLIGMQKGFFAAEGVAPEIVYVQSSAALVQQVAAGSIGISISTGLADPLRAVGMGAPIAIVRLEVQAPPYDLVAKPGIAKLSDLKGKLISLGGPKDITRIYVERMLKPNGVNPGEFDMVFAGSTAARVSALLAGAVDAAILLPAFNFQAEAKGFQQSRPDRRLRERSAVLRNRGKRRWANAHQATLEKVLRSKTRSVAWFEDGGNRAEAVQILKVASSLSQDDVEKAYDFFRNGHFFEPTGKVSERQAQARLPKRWKASAICPARSASTRSCCPA